ncbi:MAG: dTMP kinase [Candidatus Omnitrophota bacterium]
MIKLKGTLITFEGPEGSGKSTHVELLFKYLKEKIKKVVKFREPGAAALSEKIRELLLESDGLKISPKAEMLLYQASRAQFVEEELLPVLKKGYLVLLDRFTDSTFAYQGYGAGVDLKLIEKLNQFVALGIKPRLTILLDISAAEGLKRAEKCGRKDRMERKPLSFHNRVRKGYLELAKKNRKIKIIDSRNTIEEIQQEIKEVVLNAIGKRTF